jgi:hypothetical protein
LLSAMNSVMLGYARNCDTFLTISKCNELRYIR